MPGASTSGESWGRSGYWGEKSGVVGRKPGFKGGKPGFEGGKCGLPPWGGFLPMVGKSGCPGGGHCPGGGAVEAQKGRSLGFRRGNEGITPRSEKKKMIRNRIYLYFEEKPLCMKPNNISKLKIGNLK